MLVKINNRNIGVIDGLWTAWTGCYRFPRSSLSSCWFLLGNELKISRVAGHFAWGFNRKERVRVRWYFLRIKRRSFLEKGKWKNNFSFFFFFPSNNLIQIVSEGFFYTRNKKFIKANNNNVARVIWKKKKETKKIKFSFFTFLNSVNLIGRSDSVEKMAKIIGRDV